MTGTKDASDQPICENNAKHNEISDFDAKQQSKTNAEATTNPVGEGGNYWQLRYEKLLIDYDHLQKINQNLEDKLLHVVDSFEKKREELVANIEYEKSTLMADVNKLSTKLVDARIKLHDYEEKEMLHASECKSPCHNEMKSQPVKSKDLSQMQYDPNLV